MQNIHFLIPVKFTREKNKQTTPKLHRNLANSLTCLTFYCFSTSQICAVLWDAVLGHLVAMAFNAREPLGSRLRPSYQNQDLPRLETF